MSSCRLSFVGRGRAQVPKRPPSRIYSQDGQIAPAVPASKSRTIRLARSDPDPCLRLEAERRRNADKSTRCGRRDGPRYRPLPLLPLVSLAVSLMRSSFLGVCVLFRRTKLQPKGVLCRSGREGIVNRPAEGPSGPVERCASSSSSSPCHGQLRLTSSIAHGSAEIRRLDQEKHDLIYGRHHDLVAASSTIQRVRPPPPAL